MTTAGRLTADEDIKYDSSARKDSKSKPSTVYKETKDIQKQEDKSEKRDLSSSNLHLNVRANRNLAAGTSLVIFAILIQLFWPAIYTFNSWLDMFQVLIKGELWNEIQILLRCILFPLCVTSYFDTYSYKYYTSITDVMWHPFSNAIKLFLDLSFTLFWPTGRNTHKTLMHIIVALSIICVSWLDLFVRIRKINNSSEHQDWSDFFYWIKIIREIVKLHSFTVAIVIVYNFFTYNQYYNEINPWERYRRQYSKTKSLAMEYIVIISCLFLSLLSESYFIEYNKKINVDHTSWYDVLFAFICLGWRDLFIPLFNFPINICVLFGFCVLLTFNFGRNILKGILTYLIIMMGPRIILAILSLIVVWEIDTFNKSLETFIDDTFTNIDAQKIKHRFNDFETKNQQIKVLKDKLFWIIHFIIFERIISMLLDFWNFYCGQKETEWNANVFVSRHLFYLLLIGWVLHCIESFNRKYPNYIVKRLNFFRLKNFGDLCDDNNLNEARQNEKEFELWLKYIEQSSFANHFSFKIFGRIDIDWKWLMGGLSLQGLYMIYSKWNSPGNQEIIKEWRGYLHC